LFSEEDLTRYLNLTLDLYKTLQNSLQPRLHLELGLVKLVQAGKLQSIEEALAGLEKAEPARPASPVLSASSRAAAPRPPAFQAPAKPAPAAAPPQNGDLRQSFYDALCAAGMNHSADAIQRSEVRLDGGDFVIRCPKPMTLYLKDPAVQKVASQIAGKPVRVKLEVADNVAAAPVAIEAAKPPGDDQELRERALSHPGVKRFQELFPDAHVRTVRNLNE
jgi:DNA polymerase-3 subunit gamma/tau